MDFTLIVPVDKPSLDSKRLPLRQRIRHENIIGNLNVIIRDHIEQTLEHSHRHLALSLINLRHNHSIHHILHYSTVQDW